MGSLHNFLDFNSELMARKVHSHDGQIDAPRNSLDLPLESSYGLCSARDNILYDYYSPAESYSEDYYFPEAPMKKLISEEISRRPKNKQNTPSVVARLMGVDALPLNLEPSAKLVGPKNETSKQKLSDKTMDKEASSVNLFSTLNTGYYYDTERHLDKYSGSVKSSQPKVREHPQEDELQKFKKEFEAWQALRFKQCSSMVDISNAPNELIAQEELNREKMFRYSNSRKVTDSERTRETTHLTDVVDSSPEMLTLRSYKKKILYRSTEENESLHLDRISKAENKASQLMNSDQNFDNVSSPSRIVILRPGPDRRDINEDSWNSTPSISGERHKIEDFLEQVKERLRSEIQGKSSKRSSTVRGSGIETPYWEKPIEPREIAQRIAKHVRERVTRDLEMNLLRSESTRSYRSEVQFNGTGSPEFINKDTRKLLAERLTNVLKGETGTEVQKHVRSKSRLSISDKDSSIATQLKDTWMENETIYPEIYSNELKKESRSFRRESVINDGLEHDKPSPRNLVRSMSAPVSGTSFGKLLLEDRHMSTGVQIMRKHEVNEKVSKTTSKKQKKDKFNIKERVSSFKSSLTLRGKLFRWRFKSMSEQGQNKDKFSNDISYGPMMMTSFYDTHENSTEVPPSPASVCSNIHEEFWRPADCPSPVSSLGGYQMEDGDISRAFKDISSNLNELRRKLKKFEGPVLDEITHKQNFTEVEADVKDETEGYVRDLLIASGLYNGSFTQSLSKWDPLGKPISNQVYEEVEDTRKQQQGYKGDEMHGKDQGANEINHKMILDLLNEIIPMILRQPVCTSKYMEKAMSSMFKPPQGRKLLSRVWNVIRVYVHPPIDRSYYFLDNMLARDLNSEPWLRLIDDGVDVIGREIENLIIGDLIAEMVNDL